MQPKKLSGLDIAFSTDVSELMPPSIPREFYNYDNKYNKLVSGWFFKGLSKSQLKVKNGINQADAFGHMKAIMNSFEPSHEDKIASVAYLMNLWFDIV